MHLLFWLSRSEEIKFPREIAVPLVAISETSFPFEISFIFPTDGSKEPE